MKIQAWFYWFVFFFFIVTTFVGVYFIVNERSFDDRGQASGDGIVRFAVIGDGHWNITRGDNDVNNRDNYGNNLHYKYRHNLIINLFNAERASRKGLDFVVFNGDLVHNDGREWENLEEQFEKLDAPYRVVHGNHDCDEHEKRSISDWENFWGLGYDHHEEYKGMGFIFLGTGVEYCVGHYRDRPWNFNYFERWADYYIDRGMPVFLFTHIAFDHLNFGGDGYGAFGPEGQEFHNYIKNNPLVKATFFGHNHHHRGVRIIDGHPYYWSGHFGHQPPTRVNPMSYRIVEIDTNTYNFESYSVNALTGDIGDESFTGDPCGSLGKLYPDIKKYPESTTMWPSNDFCVKGTLTRAKLHDEPIVNFPSKAEDFFPDPGLRVDWECRVGINSFRCSARRLVDSDPIPDPEPPIDPDPAPDDPAPDDPAPDDPAPDEPEPEPKCLVDSDCLLDEICFRNKGICLKGDIDGTGRITMNDFSEFKKDFLSFKVKGWSEELKRSDLTGKGRISMGDYSIFVRSYRIFNGLID